MRWREFREKIRKTFKLIDILESGKRRISVSRRFLLLASVSVLVLVGIVLVGSGLAQTRSIIIWSQQQPENTTHNGSIAVSPNGQLVAFERRQRRLQGGETLDLQEGQHLRLLVRR